MGRTHKSPEESGDALLRDILQDLTKADTNSDYSIMGDGEFASEPTEWISTGITLLDRAIRGGIPVGRVVEIFGSSQSGKSLLGFNILAEAQAAGHLAALIDTEAAATMDFATRLGRVEVSSLLHVRVATMEAAFDAIDTLITTVRARDQKRVLVIVLDSLAGLATRDELDNKLVDQNPMAHAARVIRRAFRKLIDRIATERVVLVMTNQTSQKIGVPKWAEQEATYGGGGPAFFSSVRLKLATVNQIKSTNEDPVGVWVQWTVKKNRMDPPGRSGRFPVYYTTGVSDDESNVEYLYRHGKFGSTKGWIVHAGSKYRRTKFLEAMRNDPALRQSVVDMATQLFDGDPHRGEDNPDVVEDTGADGAGLAADTEE